MKNRAIIPLALGVVIGLLAIKFGLSAIQRAKGSGEPTILVDAVVASQDIGASARITSDMLVTRKTPKTPLLPADAFSSIDQLVGRVTSKGIPQGTPVLASMVAAEGTLPGIEERIPEGYRAVAVQIEESTGVAYLLRPGCFVDVIVVMEVKRANNKSETISRVILQRVQVAAVGQVLGDARQGEGATRAKSVTLIVREEDVPKLHLAQTKGKVTLAMRSEADTLVTEGAGARQSELWGEKPTEPEADAAAAVPAGGPPVGVQPASAAEASRGRPESVVVTVVNGSRADGADVSRFTFAGMYSMNVLEVTRGLTSEDPGATYAPKGATEDESGRGPHRVVTDQERQLRRQGAQSQGGAAEAVDPNRSSKEVGE